MQQVTAAATSSAAAAASPLDRIKEIKERNKKLESDLLQIDQHIYNEEISFKQSTREWAYNLEQLYLIEDTAYLIPLIYSVISKELRRQGLSDNRIDYVYKIFQDPDMQHFRISTNEDCKVIKQGLATTSNIVDTVAREQYEYESMLYHQIASFIKYVEPNLLIRDLFQFLVMEVQEQAPKLIDKADRAGIVIPGRQKKEKPSGIQYNTEPNDTELIEWLDLWITEMQKLRDKMLYTEYSTEQAEYWSRGIKVFVRLLRSMSNDKYARSWYEWLHIVYEKYRQSKHAASSHSGVVGTDGKVRTVTRESITENDPKMLSQAAFAAEHWIGFYDLIDWAAAIQNPIRAKLHNDKSPVLSENSIGHKA